MNGVGRPQALPSRQGRALRFSIGEKVPLVAAGLILLVGSAISLAAYLEVRHTARVAAVQHVQDLLKLVGTTQRTGTQLMNTARFTATRPALAAFLAQPDQEHRAAAVAALLVRNGTGVPTMMATDLMDANGQLLLTTNPATNAVPSDFPAIIPAGDSSSVGKLRTVRDSIVYPVSLRIPGTSGAYIVQWRHATASATGAQQTRQIIGATVLLGNRDGSYWTDLHQLVPAPRIDLSHPTTEPVEYTRVASEGPVIAGVVPLSGTPWAFVVETPVHEMLAASDAFLRSILVIMLGCVALGVLAAWWFGRRLTEPLEQLTEAADAIAAGGSAAGLAIERADELGRLAASFETMSRQVAESRQRLEEKVAERTQELHAVVQQLRDAQEALVRREKLAMLGQLAGGVGHELRNPLGVMNNAIYYLEMVLQSPPADVRDYLRLLRDQVALSSKIVGDLLDFARITPAQRRPVALRTIVETQIGRLPERDRARMDVELDDTIAPVEADPVHIGQVIFNLLTNALQAMGNTEGRVRIAAWSVGQDDVELRVSDDGPGIAPELLDRIFEPLFTTKARGIGLGLAVSKAMMQANDGNITVRNGPGRGATFTVVMPAATGAPA